jgi:hypothetical protein
MLLESTCEHPTIATLINSQALRMCASSPETFTSPKRSLQFSRRTRSQGKPASSQGVAVRWVDSRQGSRVRALRQAGAGGRERLERPAVLELVIALAILASLAGAGLLVMLPWELRLWAGLWSLGLGFGVGLPAAAWYHWALYRALKGAGIFAPRWWLHPTRAQQKLPPDLSAPLNVSFAVGGLGFLGVTLGMVLLASIALVPIR